VLDILVWGKMSKNRAVVLPDPEPISLKELRAVVPPHCFERSYIRSFSYIVKDALLIVGLMYMGGYLELIPYLTLRILAWFVYTFFLGAAMTGLWVIAHECGHQGFSPSQIVNDAVGCILHTVLLVPYWSWKYTHAQHHANTNSMEHDSVFVPHTDLTVNFRSKFDSSILGRLWGIFKMVTIGWLVYIWFNYASSRVHATTWNSHFNPFCALWRNRTQCIGVIASDAALVVWVYVLYRLTLHFGVLAMIAHYFVPYLWVNFWLVTITYLQHTDWVVPKYYDDKWTWMRGAFGTVDRNYGIFNILHHHIADTHVLHHIFSQIPHYHAQEATQALLKSGLIDEYYLFDPNPWYVALWENYRDCWYVKHNQKVTWFEKKKLA